MTKFAATSIDRRAALTVVAGAIALALSSRPARALYPDKYIKLIVPFPAGGGGDTLARTVAGKAGDILGQQFVIENRPGAGGNIGSTVAAAAAPDGYTVLYGTNGTLAINHALYKSTGFDPLKDFEPVGRLTEIALVAVVHPSVPATSIKELIEIAKAKPGTLNIATAGNGTTSHLAAEMFKRAAGVDMQIVHYRGGGPAMTELIAGQVQVMIEVMPNAMPQVTGKRLRGLAVSTAARWPQAPDLPTISESGLPDFVVTAWDALLVPRGTPPDVVNKLNDAIAKTLADPALQKTLLDRGAKVVPGSAAELRQFMTAEYKRWGDVVRASGASVE
jgi:tripartite-type tricarboxylate transporter receptor subunit TctC